MKPETYSSASNSSLNEMDKEKSKNGNLTALSPVGHPRHLLRILHFSGRDVTVTMATALATTAAAAAAAVATTTTTTCTFITHVHVYTQKSGEKFVGRALFEGVGRETGNRQVFFVWPNHKNKSSQSLFH